MYLTPTENHWSADIEADNLLDKATTIWVLCLENVMTGERLRFLDGESFRGFMTDRPEYILVGHNFIQYDLPMLNRFWKTMIPISRVVDTYVLSQLYSPVFAGGHSLAAWGDRLRFPKGGFHDFSRLSREMVKYCRRDVSLTAKVFVKLAERMASVGFTEDGCKLEHYAWNIIQNKQRRVGFPFDIQKAHGLYAELRQREEELRAEIHRLWPPTLECIAEYKKAFKKDGSPSAQYQRHVEQYPKVLSEEDGTYRVYDYVTFNLGSPSQRIEKLLELGWKPVNKTPKGNPKVDEDELLAFAETSGQKEVGALAKWIVINSRANMIRTWMDAYDERSRSIHGRLFIASTLRYRHSNPNSANIPAVRLKKVDGKDVVQYGEDGGYSYESRDCWGVTDPEWIMVGIDAKGIQLRCLCHNLAKMVGVETVKPFTDVILEGDPHTKNATALGLANKAAAKKFFYTLIMGGRGKRLAADQAQFGTKMTAKEGNEIRDRMIAAIPGFGELISYLEGEYDKTGRIKLCDDTPILVSSPHMVIPYLLQGDESRLMKRAMVFADTVIRNDFRNDAFKVADIHDEWQFKVRAKYADDFMEAILPVFPAAGDYYNYLVPMEGSAKKGMTWARTH